MSEEEKRCCGSALALAHDAQPGVFSVKHAFFPVYERAMPATGPFRCLRCMRSPLSPIAGMARSYTNIRAVSSFGVASGAMKVSVKKQWLVAGG